MNWVLISAIMIFVVCVAIGYKKGVVKILCSLISFMLALVLAGLVNPYIVDRICENEDIYNQVYEEVSEKIVFDVTDSEMVKDTDQAIEDLKLPKYIKNQITLEDNLGVSNFGELKGVIFTKLTDIIIRVLVYIITSVLIFLLLILIALLLGIIEKFPIATEINRLAGVAGGAVVGGVVIYILMIIVMVTEHTKISSEIIKNIYDNKWLSYMYTNNILWDYIMNFIEFMKSLKL